MSELKQQPGTVYPDEYDWKGEQGFGALNTLQPFTKCDTGKVLGLALAYEQLQADIEQREADNKRYRDALTDLTNDLEQLMVESDGVYGLHHNGDLAPWDELIKGGEFEDWLRSYNVALVIVNVQALENDND